MAEEEKERISNQAKELGEEGLSKKAEELKQAMAQNEVGGVIQLYLVISERKTLFNGQGSFRLSIIGLWPFYCC